MLATLGDPGNKKPIGIRSGGPLMLPGFNHNIRHQDRVFHVQTEDNGLAQARLVTQTFINGQIVDIERCSYKDLIDGESDDKARTDLIRVRMQEQHKRQMKRLVSGTLDDRIATLFTAATPSPPLATPAPQVQSPVPDAVLQAAEALPNASTDLALTPAAPVALPPAAPVELPTLDMPAHPALRSAEQASSDDPARQSHPDFLIELDEEMRRHAPWRPTEAQLARGQQLALETTKTIRPANVPSKPIVKPLPAPVPQPTPHPATRPLPNRTLPQRPSPILRSGTVPVDQQLSTPRPAGSRAVPQPREAARRIAPQAARPLQGRALPPGRVLPPGRPAFPTPGDTIVDMGLPASLKETLAKRRAMTDQASPPRAPSAPRARPQVRPRPAPPPQAPRGLAPRPRPGQIFESPNDTMLEIDAAELQVQVAAQRARLRQQAQNQAAPPPTQPPPPKLPEARGNIVVVERSLDDVILGYLSSDD